MGLSASIINGLNAAFAMARGRPDWAEGMDMSASAVFRSFWALPLALVPLVLATSAARQITIIEGQTPAALPLVLVDSVVTATVIWMLIVGFYVQISRKLGAGWRISPVLIVNNYATLLGYSLLGLGTGAAAIAGDASIFALIWPLVMAMGIWLDWGMLRRGLELPVDVTLVAIVFVQFAALVLAMIISEIVAGLMTLLGLIP